MSRRKPPVIADALLDQLLDGADAKPFANIAGRAHDRNLKTNTTWWEMHGGRVRTALVWMAANRTFQLGAGLASIVGVALALWALW